MALSRRDFLKWSGAMGASLGVSSLFKRDLFAFSKLPPGEGYYLPTETRFSMCGTCDNNCGVVLHLQDGVIKEITGNPADKLQSGGKGKICVKGQSAMRNLYDPNLLKTPLKRTNPIKGVNNDPGFVKISWDEAFQLIASKIQSAIQDIGPKANLFLMRPKEDDMHFVKAIGTPNQTCHVDTCYMNHDGSWTSLLANGKSRTFEIEKSDYILSFGWDIPGKSKMAQLNGFLEARENGARIVVLDPRLSVTAHFADEWIPIKPGTDLAFALAMIHVILNEEIYNKNYVAQFCYGLQELKDHVNSNGYTPSWAAGITGVPATTISQIARDFAYANNPMVPHYKRDAGGPIYFNSFGLSQSLVILTALTGGFETVGGFWFPRKPPSSPSLKDFAPDKTKYPAMDGTVRVDGQHMFPVINGAFGGKSKGNFSHLADGLRRARLGEPFPDGSQSYPIKVIIVHKYNTHSFPNPDAIITELSQPDRFMVVLDTIPNNLCWLADVVLPEPWWLESKSPFAFTDQHALWASIKLKDGLGALWERKGYGGIVNGILNKLYPGKYDIDWTTLNVLRAANAIGTTDPVGWLKANNGIWENNIYPPEAKNLAGLKTSTGKIELYSEKLKKYGHEPMPTWHPKLMEPSSADEFYFVTHHNPYQRMNKNCNDYLIMDLQPENFIHMHPDSANGLGLKNGDYALVEGKTGKIARIRVKTTLGIRKDTVMIEHGYGHFSKLLEVAYGKGVNDGDLLPDRNMEESMEQYAWNPAMASAISDAVVRVLGKA